MRRAITKIVARKQGWAVVKYGRVQFRAKDEAALDAFLRGFDPELAQRRAQAKSGRAEAFLQELLRG